MKKESKPSLKYKFYLLGALALIVIFASGVLMWQIKEQSPRNDSSGKNELLSEIDNLNKKIDELNKSLAEVKNQSPIVESRSYTKSTSGQVAGEQSSREQSSGINLNTASLSQLDSLPGIGPAYAQRIIDYREANGGFKSIEEVQNIKGIGEKTFQKFRDLVTI